MTRKPAKRREPTIKAVPGGYVVNLGVIPVCEVCTEEGGVKTSHGGACPYAGLDRAAIVARRRAEIDQFAVLDEGVLRWSNNGVPVPEVRLKAAGVEVTPAQHYACADWDTLFKANLRGNGPSGDASIAVGAAKGITDPVAALTAMIVVQQSVPEKFTAPKFAGWKVGRCRAHVESDKTGTVYFTKGEAVLYDPASEKHEAYGKFIDVYSTRARIRTSLRLHELDKGAC